MQQVMFLLHEGMDMSIARKFVHVDGTQIFIELHEIIWYSYRVAVLPPHDHADVSKWS